MQAWNEKNILESDFPFKLWISNGVFNFPPHWHEEIEIIYMLEGKQKVGLNDKIYTLKARDILLIGSGSVHYFLLSADSAKPVLIQFGLSLFDNISTSMNDRKFIRPLFSKSSRVSGDWDTNVHEKMEKQIVSLVDEYQSKREGYHLAIKARLYDLILILLREVPAQKYTDQEIDRQTERLERLDGIFEYVEKNYLKEITIDEISRYSGYSPFYFTRIFKNTTGLTFGQYLRNFRVTKAQWYLMNTDDSISQVAYKSGFNSIKTFNRVFKEVTGRSPSQYKEEITEQLLR